MNVETLVRESIGATDAAIRHDWTTEEIAALFDLPFNDLIFRAQAVHRQYFDANEVQLSTLLSIKTGGCAEDCKYCPQSSHYDTGLKAEKLMAVERIVQDAARAKEMGATRYCMGAAWREPKDRDIETLAAITKAVKGMGLETCMTLGMLTQDQADTLAEAGLDYYNHNIDTSPEYYAHIITTRNFEDRLETLGRVRKAGMKVCSGGILGMGETRLDRVRMLQILANLEMQPESVPINNLIGVPGTPFADGSTVDSFEFVRTIAVARILMPRSHVRLSAGREDMSEETQALCFLAGANSIFYGEKLLTRGNPKENEDMDLLGKLGMRPENAEV